MQRSKDTSFEFLSNHMAINLEKVLFSHGKQDFLLYEELPGYHKRVRLVLSAKWEDPLIKIATKQFH